MSNRQPTPDFDEVLPLLIKKWRRFHKNTGPLDHLQTREFRVAVEHVKALQKQGWKQMESRDQIGAYLLYPWMIHYQEGLSLINELPNKPKRVLDLCSGPGAFAFAALRHGAREVVAVGEESTSLELGAEICGSYGFPLTIRTWKEMEIPRDFDEKFDLIILGHGLQQLFSFKQEGWQHNALNYIQQLQRLLTPEGSLLIVDGSDVQTNHQVLSLRNLLVESGYPVQAPCVWRGRCPALETKNSPCYAQRKMEKPELLREMQRACEINLGSLKMTYLIVRKQEAAWPTDRKDLYRVISPPVEMHRGKAFYLCGHEGKKRLESQMQKPPKAFEYLKRGELISVKDPMKVRGLFAVGDQTAIEVEAACGKPLSHN